MRSKFSIAIISLIILFTFSNDIFAWNQPPIARLKLTHLRTLTGTKVILDSKDSYDPDGYIKKIEWDIDGDGDYGDGPDIVEDPVHDMKAEYVYSPPSTRIYFVSVRVTDNEDVERKCYGGLMVYTVTSRIYVDRNAPIGGNGESWTTAYQELRTALDNATYGTEIWVAQGIYTPTNDGDRNKSFQLKAATAVYGGFQAGATDITERNPKAHPTILSGNIQGDNYDYNNSYHVVKGADGAILDGFIITEGYGSVGGGMYNKDCSPIVSNCVFTKNYADGGGAICNNEEISYQNLTFVTAKHCVFSDNRALSGGAIRNLFCYSDVNNCIFYNNLAGGGGGIYCHDTILRVTNCTFWNNRASGAYGGGIYHYDYDDRHIQGESFIVNSILWENSDSDGKIFTSQIYEEYEQPYRKLYTDLYNSIHYDGGFTGFFPYFVNPEAGNFHLANYSTCIDKGKPSHSYSQEPGDGGGRINLGAYGNTPKAALIGPDEDIDEMIDTWELLYWNDISHFWGADEDGDGIWNLHEYWWNGNPTKAPFDIRFDFDDLANGQLRIKYRTYNNVEFYSIALKVVVDGATLDSPYANKIISSQPELDCYIDYAHSHPVYNLGDGHPIADVSAAGEPTGNLSEFSINMAAVGTGIPVSSPGGYTNLITLQFTSSGGNEADVTVSVDPLRSSFINYGWITNLPQTAQVTFGQ